jgi:hypothetical protein
MNGLLFTEPSNSRKEFFLQEEESRTSDGTLNIKNMTPWNGHWERCYKLYKLKILCALHLMLLTFYYFFKLP